MLDKNDKDFLKKTFPTKNDLKKGLYETRQGVVKDVTDYLQQNVIPVLNEHEARLDRLEKTVGGFRPITG